MIREVLRRVVSGQLLSEEEAAGVAERIMTGGATPAQIGGLLAALATRGETPEEMAGMARAMRARAIRVATDGQVVDLVGTGGDQRGTFNISTASAFVAAAAGVTVAKHGNRAASSQMGSADILEAHGVNLELGPEGVRRCLEEVGIAFLFARFYHPAMRYAAEPRRDLGIRTIFNLVGPLTNPAGARYQVIGVPSERIGEKVARVLKLLGTARSWVVHGADGLDELTTTDRSLVWEVQRGTLHRFELRPEEVGLARASLQDLRAADEPAHARLFAEALGRNESAPKDVVLLNAAAALVVTGKVPGLREGVEKARVAVDSGAALERLRRLAQLSQEL